MALDFILDTLNDLATREQLVELCKELYEEYEISEKGAVVLKHKK